jgi:hypothetical protein
MLEPNLHKPSLLPQASVFWIHLPRIDKELVLKGQYFNSLLVSAQFCIGTTPYKVRFTNQPFYQHYFYPKQ